MGCPTMLRRNVFPNVIPAVGTPSAAVLAFTNVKDTTIGLPPMKIDIMDAIISHQMYIS
jgi:hypothetical protein